ncbi:LPS-assembly protein LptD [Magnetovibrio blakemorei]|uniref:LPS-assembly protein LptD n=1 Tax=Magnetovibrio blakemorei TaxID=28181 RepID=A0A1E5Q9Y7_9PROT|nr:LPS assembly protein LptD [Magnetovibrio blakemorei]OEJ68532.1 hypothetical protein BEN30_06300 [Magnetovibrio blakemorei]
MTIKHTLLATALFAVAVLLGALASTPARAEQGQNEENPATFAADEMTHDKELSIITARGHVEVNHGERTLLADSISYNQITDAIKAYGNVALHQPSGDILFADTMEITGDLKNGMADDLLAVMADRSRFAAKKATLVNDETMTMDRAIYSACEPCKDNPTRPLLWQLKAIKIVHDRTKKIITYKDVWLEVMGVPVVYTPYLSYPDPTVKRKSGFLTPNWGASSSLGSIIQAPYFYVLDDSSDITITPLITSQEYGAIHGEYREKFTKGEITAETSGAFDASSRAYGHIKSEARFDVDRTWRWGADLNRSSSDTYMRRYGYGNESSLTSQAFLEGFRGNTYTSFSTMAFQGLSASDDSRTSPLVLPVAQFNYTGDPDKYGAYNALDLNFTKLTRELGTDSTRISVRPSWNISHIAPKGDIYKLRASMGLDFFNAQELPVPQSRGSTYDGSALRPTPELEFDWSWPLARRNGTVTEVLEPIGQVIVSPYGGNSFKMANEDSQDFDFSDANVFSANRFTGYDRVESGPRANFGAKWSVTGDGGGSTSVLVGQSYRLKDDSTFNSGSGLENNFSDYVGKIDFSPQEGLNLLYRTRIDKDTLDFRRHEVAVSGTTSSIDYNANYVFFERQEGSEFSGRKEINYAVGGDLTDTWRARFNGVRDLSENGGQRSTGLSLIYEDECLEFSTQFSRTFYQDRDLRPTDAIMFRVLFKTLGEFSSSVNPS